jgi:predicted O-methyltransferase YrrM
MLLTEKLEDYIINHSDKEDVLLYELYRETNMKIYHPRMISGHNQGKVLEFFVHMMQPDRVLEIGTYTGYSAISMTGALKDGAKLITIEANDELETFTRGYFDRSGLSDKIDFRVGDAKSIIPELDETFDMVFIDAEKSEYIDYYELVLPKVKTNGIILADNVLWSGKVVEENLANNDHFTKGILAFNKHVQDDKRVSNVVLPFRDGIMMIRKL